MTRKLFRKKILLSLLITGSLIGTTWALTKPTFTETFAPLSPVSCEGLKLDGVSYSFTVAGAPSLDCNARTSAGPGNTNHIQSPNIEGTSAGVLHLVLDAPTTEFSFGVARSLVSPPPPFPSVPDSVIVDLFRPGAGLLRDHLLLDPTNDPLFVGGQFNYEGPAVKTVTISFTTPPLTRFAIDNVTYFRPPGQQCVN